jgi:glucarate dehydratase
MRIIHLRVTPVNIPLVAPMWWTGGLYPGTSKIVIEIETDQGLVGLGEAPSTEMLRTVEAMGERLDSNMLWSLPTARRILREIEP